LALPTALAVSFFRPWIATGDRRKLFAGEQRVEKNSKSPSESNDYLELYHQKFPDISELGARAILSQVEGFKTDVQLVISKIDPAG
jgi:hypothetical protein